MIIIVVLIVILVVIMFIPLQIRLIRNNIQNDIDLYIVTKDIKIDIDELIDEFKFTPKTPNVLNDFITYFTTLNKSKNIFKSTFNLSDIKKLSLTFYPKVICDFVLFDFSCFFLSNYISSYILSNFKKCDNIYIDVSLDSNNHTKCINFEIVLKIKLVYFIYACIYNFTDFRKIVKSFRRKNESNK